MKKIAVIMSDLRQCVVADNLEKLHYEVKRIERQEDLMACLKYDALSLPIRGCDSRGQICINKNVLDFEPFIEQVSPNLIVFTGIHTQPVEKWNLKIVYLLDKEEVIEANALLTAQGVLAYILDNIDRGIREINFDVIGYGHCGAHIVAFLNGLNAHVRIISSKGKSVKELQVCEEVVSYNDFKHLDTVGDVVINTAPIMLCDELVMKRWLNKPLILDIASAPGGIDFKAAKLLGINALLLPSLPPLYTPISAGIILSKKIDGELKNG